MNPLTKLRNRNRLQMNAKLSTTVRPQVSQVPKRSPLLPRRKTTEAPIEPEAPVEADEQDEGNLNDANITESSIEETSTAASSNHEETRGLSSLLAPRRRIAQRRPGQLY